MPPVPPEVQFELLFLKGGGLAELASKAEAARLAGFSHVTLKTEVVVALSLLAAEALEKTDD